jgi:hypothetical protein
MNEFHLMIHVAGRTDYKYLDGGSRPTRPGRRLSCTKAARADGRRRPGSGLNVTVGTPANREFRPRPAPPSTGTGLAKTVLPVNDHSRAGPDRRVPGWPGVAARRANATAATASPQPRLRIADSHRDPPTAPRTLNHIPAPRVAPASFLMPMSDLTTRLSDVPRPVQTCPKCWRTCRLIPHPGLATPLTRCNVFKTRSNALKT